MCKECAKVQKKSSRVLGSKSCECKILNSPENACVIQSLKIIVTALGKKMFWYLGVLVSLIGYTC